MRNQTLASRHNFHRGSRRNSAVNDHEFRLELINVADDRINEFFLRTAWQANMQGVYSAWDPTTVLGELAHFVFIKIQPINAKAPFMLVKQSKKSVPDLA
jgi:hypothetical protein